MAKKPEEITHEVIEEAIKASCRILKLVHDKFNMEEGITAKVGIDGKAYELSFKPVKDNGKG